MGHHHIVAENPHQLVKNRSHRKYLCLRGSWKVVSHGKTGAGKECEEVGMADMLGTEFILHSLFPCATRREVGREFRSEVEPGRKGGEKVDA